MMSHKLIESAPKLGANRRIFNYYNFVKNAAFHHFILYTTYIRPICPSAIYIHIFSICTNKYYKLNFHLRPCPCCMHSLTTP